jgi:hypothetical protein
LTPLPAQPAVVDADIGLPRHKRDRITPLAAGLADPMLETL